MSVDIIDDYLNLFHLDRRSSVRELEIAYDVITKNLDEGEIFIYRKAFEYLMTEFFCVVEVKNEENITSIEQEFIEDNVELIPEQVMDSIIWCEENVLGEPINDKSKLIWATQNINLPMLTKNILTNCKNFFGIKIWTEKDICNILKNSCLNPIEYYTVSFDMSVKTFSYKQKELKKFVKSMKKLYTKDNLLKIFNIDEHECGVCGYIVAEKEVCSHIMNILKHKAEQYQYYLNISTTLK